MFMIPIFQKYNVLAIWWCG